MDDQATISGGDPTSGANTPAPSVDTQTAVPSQVPAAGNTAGLTDGGGQPQAAATTPDAAAAATTAPAVPPEFQARFDAYERQLQQLAPIAQAFYAQQQQAAADARRKALEAEQTSAQQAAKKVWDWGLPQFDRGLLQMVRKNPQTGELEALPGAPPDAVSQYHRFSNALVDFQMGLATDPAKYLQGPIEAVAAQVAQRIVDQHLGGFQARQSSAQIVERNANWLFNGGDEAAGLSPAGQVYRRAVADLGGRLGVTDPATLHELAVQQVKLAAFEARAQQSAAVAGGQQQKQQFLAQAQAGRTPPGHAAAVAAAPPAGANGHQPSLAERLKAAFHANGITDQSLANAAA